MSRNMYGATSADFTITSGGRVIPGAVLTLWTARTGGTQITDLLDVDSVACTTVTSAADGSVVYYGPNNDKTVHWADSGQGSRVAIRPTDITGDPPVMSIGTVGTGTAAASLTGTSEAPVLNLTLPSAGANGVDTAAIQSKAVTAAKIADDTITAAQIAANAVGSSELADSAVDTAAIADGAVTSAKIADGTIVSGDVAASTFAAFGTVGNLLTANQASGGDTLGDATGFVDSGHETTRIYITSDSKNGAGCIKTTLVGASSPLTDLSGAFACTPGEAVTFLVALKVAATSGKVRANLRFKLADDSYVYVEGTNLTGSAWGWATVTSVAPATAVSVTGYIYAYDFAPGEYYLLDSPSIHKGAGGTWQLPGVPIPGQGAIKANGAVELPGGGYSPEGVVTASPGSTFLQTSGAATETGMLSWRKATGTGNTGWVAEGALADTGWRDISASLRSGLAKASTVGKCRIRRRGTVVDAEFHLTASSGSITTLLSTSMPTGFTPDAQIQVPAWHTSSADSALPLTQNTGYISTSTAPKLATAIPNPGTVVWAARFTTSSAWPSSLPGSAA